MSATRPIIDAVVEHLQAAIPWVSVEAFPERPSEYQIAAHYRRPNQDLNPDLKPKK